MPIFCRFRDITIYWSKIYGFSPFCLRLGCSPRTYNMKFGLEKLVSLRYRWQKQHDPTAINFDALPACD